MLLPPLMDNVCHTLVGAAMGEAGLNRRSRFGNAALMISANAPDVDVLVFFTDTSSVAFRRGWTHGIAAQLVLPVLVTAALWAWHRLRPARADAPRFRAGWTLVLAVLGVYSHVFLDYLNNYGVRLLTPLDWRWFYGDSLFIVDLWLWLALGAGVWLGRRRRVSGSNMVRPAKWAGLPARWALALAVCYIAAMMISARASRAIISEAWQREHGIPPRSLMVGPRLLTPFTRDVILDAGDRYEVGAFDWRSGRVTWAERPIPKNDVAPEVGAARSDRRIKEFLVWSRFPFWDIEPAEPGVRVTLRDARFMGAIRGFAASVVIPSQSGLRIP
jgi:inner membrane protein